jgi:potassium efflux system protein
MFWLVFGLCWKVLEKDGVAVKHFNMPAQLRGTSATPAPQ